MTAIDVKTADIVGTRAGQRTAAETEWRFMWAGIVIGGVLGVISGLAEGNSLFTGNGNLVPLLTWTIIGTVIGVVALGGAGAIADYALARAKQTA